MAESEKKSETNRRISEYFNENKRKYIVQIINKHT